MPIAIQAAIDGHLSLLPTESLRLLQIASVAGQAFEAMTLSSSYGEAVALVLERLRPAVQAEILRRCSRSEFEFTNPLYHQRLYASQPLGVNAIRHDARSDETGHITSHLHRSPAHDQGYRAKS